MSQLNCIKYSIRIFFEASIAGSAQQSIIKSNLGNDFIFLKIINIDFIIVDLIFY